MHEPSGLLPLFRSIEDAPIVRDRRACISLDGSAFFDGEYPASIPAAALPNAGVDLCIEYSLKLSSILKKHGIAHEISEDTKRLKLSARVGVAWLFKNGELEQSTRDTASCASASELCLPNIVQMLEAAGVPEHKLFWPGDTVVPLYFDGCGTPPRVLLVLVFHFQIKAARVPRKTLLVVEMKHSDEVLSEVEDAVSARLLQARLSTNGEERQERYVPHVGRLADGRRYIVYRMLLYCDDFQPFSTRRGSAGGCYMLPLGVPPVSRAGCGAVRILGLTPPGVSTNEVLAEIIPDILQGTTEGFELTDANGERVTAFLDVVGFVGDYPAVTHALDILGHNAGAPCHLCAFQRDEGSGTGASRYGYSTEAHARSNAFVRTGARVLAVRDGERRNAHENRSSALRGLGLKPGPGEAPLPLHSLSKALEEVRHRVPLTELGLPVVPAALDPYQSCFVAPDHLLSGLAIDVINTVLATATTEVRSIAEALIRDSVGHSCSMKRQNRFFASSPPSLLSMTLSGVFAVLVVAPQAFRNAYAIAKSRGVAASRKRPRGSSALAEDAIALLQQYKDLVAEAHFLPSAEIDGDEAVLAFNARGGKKRMERLYGLACDYLRALNRMCTASDEARRHLDKPNVHRLLELFVHTLPALGHLHHIQELVFETAHQPLKRAMRGSNYRSEQLFAVNAALASDWESRLAMEVERALESGEEWSSESCLRIERLVTGDARLCQSSMSTFAVQSAFVPPLIAELSAVRRRQCKSLNGRDCWLLHDPEAEESPEVPNAMLAEARAASLAWCSSQRPGGCIAGNVSVFKAASRFRRSALSASGRRTLVRRASVSQGSILQAPCVREAASGIQLLETAATAGKPAPPSSFWYVICFMQETHEKEGAGELEEVEQSTLHAQPMAAVLPCVCQHSEGRECAVRIDTESSPALLKLSHCVRETLFVHSCRPDSCIASDGEPRKLKHSPSLEDGGEVIVYGRTQGYPPRTA
jgi:hypothetical protein